MVRQILRCAKKKHRTTPALKHKLLLSYAAAPLTVIPAVITARKFERSQSFAVIISAK